MLKLDRQFGLYVIREPLALGSSKASCRAEDPFFDRDVVLKLIGPEEVGGRNNLSLLEPYLDSLSGFEHPAIAPLYDSGIEGDACYFTTSYYSGGSLADQLTTPMDIDKAIKVILQLCSGLAYADNEGFEHGKLSLKDIFFSADGHAVISDLGITATLHKIKLMGAQADTSATKGLKTETLFSIGEILTKLLLGSGAKPDAVSIALLRQSHSQPVVELIADLLGESEKEIPNFGELLERLTDLDVRGLEVDINEHIAQPNTSQISLISSGLKHSVTPSQRQLEIKEAVYAKGEIRRLVAEKSKLQEILRRATVYKKNAEKKLAEGAAAIATAEESEAQALRQAQIALDQAAIRQQTSQHPALWLTGGLLAGILLTGGYSHFQATPAPYMAQEQSPTAQTVTAKYSTVPVSTTPLATTDKTTISTPKPTLEETALWWPAGGEFSASAALPVSMVSKKQFIVNITKQDETAPSKREADEAKPKPDILVVAAESLPMDPGQSDAQRWWAAGAEFNSAANLNNLEVLPYEDCLDVLCVVQNWAKAWSNKDPETYFSYYSTEYRPEPGHSQEEWRSTRLSRLSRPQWIKVMLDDFKIRSFSEDRIQVKLTQHYSSDYYQDQILKSLNLVKENGYWKILTERSLGAITTINSNDMIGG